LEAIYVLTAVSHTSIIHTSGSREAPIRFFYPIFTIRNLNVVWMKQTREVERQKVEVNMQVLMLMITTIVADFRTDFHIVV